MTYPHSCIKCKAPYSDEDIDPYLCQTCIEQKNIIAAEIDAKMANRPKERVMSDLEIALEKGQTINSAHGGQATFVRASDLGIRMGA